jgi:hypothetical protein
LNPFKPEFEALIATESIANADIETSELSDVVPAASCPNLESAVLFTLTFAGSVARRNFPKLKSVGILIPY